MVASPIATAGDSIRVLILPSRNQVPVEDTEESMIDIDELALELS